MDLSTTRRGAAAISVAAFCLALPVAAGDLNSEVNSMFDNLGAVGNYTAPGAFHGQAMNTYSGGSLMVRYPNKRYQLSSVSFPSLKSSCSGIDAFGGAFSVISGDQLKEMLKRITSALPGVAFQIALDAASPLFGGLTKYFKQYESMFNMSSRSSCEMATALVRGGSQAAGLDNDTACRLIATGIGMADDYTDAEQMCATDKSAVVQAGEASGDPAIAATVPFTGNLVWEALSKIPATGMSLDDAEKEMIMNITGSMIYPRLEEETAPEPLYPTLTSINQLLYGETVTPSGDVEIEMWRCDEYESCLRPVLVKQRFTPMSLKVRGYMETLLAHLRDRTAIPNNSPVVGFVNMSSEPVYRMLAMVSAGPDTGLADSLMTVYQEVLAVDFAYQLLRRQVGIGMVALDKTSKLNREQQDYVKELQRRITWLVSQLGQEKTAKYARVQSLSSMTARLDTLEREMRRNVPEQVAELLGRAALSPR